jgi:hypothetical protein
MQMDKPTQALNIISMAQDRWTISRMPRKSNFEHTYRKIKESTTSALNKLNWIHVV